MNHNNSSPNASSSSDIIIGQRALSQKLISSQQLQTALEKQKSESHTFKKPLVQVLVQEKMLTSSQIQVLLQETQVQNTQAPPAQPESLQQDSQLTANRYAILDKLGEGGMGTVYHVEDTTLKRQVALKILKQQSELDLARFQREVQTIAKLKHPGITQLLDFGEWQNKYFFTMEYIKGLSLEDYIDQKKSFTTRQIASLMHDVAQAMYFVHRRGIVHRDLKPANIMLTEELEPKIMDFGLAKVTQDDQQISQSGILVGTIYYMPPEQVHGLHDEIDSRSDVYAMGVILYQLLTDRLPFSGNSIAQVSEQILQREAISPSKVKAKVPSALSDICMKAMRKDKSARYPSAAAFADDLKSFLRGETIHNNDWQYQVKNLLRQHRGKIFSVVATIFICVIFIFGQVYLNQRARQQQIEDLEQKITQEIQFAKSPQNWSHLSKQQIIPIDQQRAIENAIEHSQKAIFYIQQLSLLTKKDQRKKMLVLERNVADLAILIRNYSLARVAMDHCASLGDTDTSVIKEKIQESNNWLEKERMAKITKIYQHLRKGKVDDWQREDYLSTVIQMSSPRIKKHLIDSLTRSSAPIRLFAIDALGRIKDKDFIHKKKRLGLHLVDMLKKINAKKFKLKGGNRVTSKDKIKLIWALGRLREGAAHSVVSHTRRSFQRYSGEWENTKIPARLLPHKELKKNQKSPKYWLDLAHRCETQGRHAEAAEAREKCIELDPSIQRKRAIYPSLASNYKHSGDYKNAIRVYNLIEKDMRQQEQNNRKGKGWRGAWLRLHHNRGTVYTRTGEYDKAIQDYNVYIKGDKKWEGAYRCRASAWFAKGKYGKALKDINKAIKVSRGKVPHCFTIRASIYVAQGKHKEAIQDTTSAIKLQPKAASYYLRGTLYHEGFKDLQKAQDDYQRALEIDPRHVMARMQYNKLQTLLSQQKNKSANR